MKLEILIVALSVSTYSALLAQNPGSDTTRTIKLSEVVVSANRMPVLLLRNPGAISLITPEELSNIPKGIAAEEALRLVPGVRIDNQHDGERVHISIRGQGILTERGLRGIGVLIDGIPANDPSGFVPDLYDVEWSTIKKIEVLRGPAAGLYGSGGSAGVINITTSNKSTKPAGGQVNQTLGSNGFFKELIQAEGSLENIDYSLTYSRTDGAGYRDHQAFWGNKLYEKISFHPTKKLSIVQIISHTDYFHQNPEGLNIGQFNNLRQANPDACPFNEYQKTNRTTFGIRGIQKFNESHDIEVIAYIREWKYKETSNRCAEYRDYDSPGASIQYNLHLLGGNIKQHFSIGADFKWQNINIYKLQSVSNPSRIESLDETNIENDSLLANQIITQSSTGVFALYHFSAGKLNILGNIRYDVMKNDLTNKMMAINTSKTSKDFTKLSSRLGASYSINDAFTLFANWSQGFIPPSTEELASNPLGYSGFNTHLVPATSSCFEMGFRGFIGKRIYYDLTGFLMQTENDFFRFKQSGRGNQEVFYGNAGNSKRIGIESFISFKIHKNLDLQVAYTFADYKYTSATIDPVYTDTVYVLTIPPAAGQFLPNSPQHQLYAEIVYRLKKHFVFTFSTEYQSRWAIYTDAKAYNGELDPAIYQNWQDGLNLYHARISYLWRIRKLDGECNISIRNFTAQKYMAFTEPDPDGNSYQPGPGREIFASIKVRF
jgi:iron complex outermembrane recepter protein